MTYSSRFSLLNAAENREMIVSTPFMLFVDLSYNLAGFFFLFCLIF